MRPSLARTLLAVAAFAALTGCSTTRHEGFERVRVGMDKASVLETAGNPDKTRRWQGKDRWTYSYLVSDTNAEIKEVHFEEGRVVYVGTEARPAISADEQDRRNETQNMIDKQATFDVPGSTYIQVVKPNWENINAGDADDSSASQAAEPEGPTAPAQKPVFEKIQ